LDDRLTWDWKIYTSVATAWDAPSLDGLRQEYLPDGGFGFDE
jgi:hypothetical protein